jgi:hypothetical protein
MSLLLLLWLAVTLHETCGMDDAVTKLLRAFLSRFRH